MNRIAGFIAPLLYLTGISVAAFAQSPSSLPAFEAASVKPTAPTGGLPRRTRLNGGPGTSDPGRIDYQSIIFSTLVAKAYNLQFYRLSAPTWFNTERYDIVAKLPVDATEDQLQQMLRNLLAERFKLAAHYESKITPVYELSVANGGPKFKTWTAEDERRLAEAKATPPPPAGTVDGDGYPVFPAAMTYFWVNSHARMHGIEEVMPNFAEFLSGVADRPVLDATGLKGKYAFTLSWILPNPFAPAPPDASLGPDISAALREQLGLTLQPKKAPIEMLIVDHAEKTPVEN